MSDHRQHEGEASEASHAIEPRLLEAAPRRVRLRPTAHVARWGVVALLLVIPSAAYFFGSAQQAKFERLRSHGVEAVGTLTKKEPRAAGKHGHPARGVYEYVVAGKKYTTLHNFTEEEFAALPWGDRKTIVYSADDPTYAQTRERLEQGRRYASESIGLWMAGGTIGATLLIALGAAEWTRLRRVRLAKYGRPVATSSLQVERAVMDQKGKRWKVAYTFEHAGRSYSGSRTYGASVIRPLLESVATATVLFDPANPCRNELYFGVRRTVEWLAANE